MSDMQKKDASSAAPALLPSGSSSNSTGAQQVQPSQKNTGRGQIQEKSGTMYLNEFKQRKGESNTVEYKEYKCSGFTEDKPLYGCKAYVNGVLKGQSENHPNHLDARKAAADQAAKVLGLVEKGI